MLYHSIFFQQQVIFFLWSGQGWFNSNLPSQLFCFTCCSFFLQLWTTSIFSVYSQCSFQVFFWSPETDFPYNCIFSLTYTWQNRSTDWAAQINITHINRTNLFNFLLGLCFTIVYVINSKVQNECYYTTFTMQVQTFYHHNSLKLLPHW